MSKYEATLGADPELFVTIRGDKEIIPICGLVGGTKSEPLSMAKHPSVNMLSQPGVLDDGYKYQEDGVAYEFNIPYTTNSKGAHTKAFYTSISLALAASERIMELAGLSMVFDISSHRFRSDQLLDVRANTIGCDPDYRAYDSDGKISPVLRNKYEAKDFGTTRFTGGHLHFGYDKDLADPHIFAALVDTFVYLPALRMDRQTDRRRFYGQAGLYRPKPYGIEYRTMSNFWLKGEALKYISMQAFSLLDVFHQDAEWLAGKFQQIPHDRVRAIIDTGVTNYKQAAEHRALCHLISMLGEDITLFYNMRLLLYKDSTIHGELLEEMA